jgi:hypothetical protein
MTTKKEMIELIKSENPDGLQLGDDENGYVKLSQKETQDLFEQWAEARLEKELRKVQAKAKETAKAAILDRLGITAEEAKLLLS